MKMHLLSQARERAGAPAREYGLAVLTAMTAAEVYAEARPAAAHGFYSAIGRRLATLVDLSDVHDIEGLADRINRLWSACGCGQARLQAVDTGIKITHRGAPAAIEGDHAGYWAQLFPAILEGAYDAWFRQLGSGQALSTRILHQEGDVIELHHGV
jgi:hypothetical protein